jgi:primary-amine oxidase
VQIVTVDKDKTNSLHELIVDLDKSAVDETILLKGRHSYIDPEYMQAVEKACLADEQVQAEIKKLHVPTGSTVCVEPWAYATDGMNDMTQRVSMVCSVPCSANVGFS